MAETVNTNVFDANKKFVDFAGLDYFWGKAKTYIDDVDATMSAKVLANEQAIAAINDELDSLSGGAGSIQTQINNAISALDLPNTYDVKGAAEDAETAAKAYADGLAVNYESAGAAAQALADAKADAAEKYQVKGDYEAAGAAAQALVDAKAYVDGKDSAMDARVKVLEAIDHDALAADAAASAVATILDEAPASFDTLKEVADWIANNDHASDVATLVTDVANLKAIDHEAYKGADETVLADAKAYADGLVMDGETSRFDTKGSADAAEKNAKDYADAEIAKLSFDEAGTAKSLADAAEKNAKDYADGKFQEKGNYEVAGTAAGLNEAMDARVKVLEGQDVYVAAIVNQAIADAEAAAKADAAEKLKGYYTKTEVDNLLSTNSQADQIYAKTYTDALFNSFQFAANSDIDALFAPKAE